MLYGLLIIITSVPRRSGQSQAGNDVELNRYWTPGPRAPVFDSHSWSRRADSAIAARLISADRDEPTSTEETLMDMDKKRTV